MARPLRLELPGALYHLTSRDNARLPICEDDEGRQGFLATLSAAIERFDWLCHASGTFRPAIDLGQCVFMAKDLA